MLLPGVLAKIQAVVPGLTFEMLLLRTSPADCLDRGEADLLVRLIKPPVEIPELTESVQWNAHRDEDPGIL